MTDHYLKTIRDTFEDTAEVEAYFDGGVSLVVSEERGGGRSVATLAFSPKRARKLAKALDRAADVADGIIP